MLSMKCILPISHPSFKSRNNPIKPYVINTKIGQLSCFEIPTKQLLDDNIIKEFSKFFCKNFASLTEDPYWLNYNKKSHQKDIAKEFSRYLRNKIVKDDGNLTMLIATDENNKLQGACFSYAFDEIPFVKNTTCYIDSLAINLKYRGFGVGKNFVNKTCEINKNTFTDVFLRGEVLAYKFYKKLGFSKLNKANPGQRFVARFIESSTGEGIEYLNLLTKPLQENKPRWYSIFDYKTSS